MKTKLSRRASQRIVLAAAFATSMLSPCLVWSAIDTFDLASTNSTAALSRALESDLMLVGPVETVDAKAGALQALGQVVRLQNNSALVRVRAGSVVEVRGRITGPGEIQATSVRLVSNEYVAGAQSVLIRGLVTSIRPEVGQLTIGRLVVDYTGALYSLDANTVSVGSQFLASGIQPVGQGSFVALTAVGSGELKGIGGTDLKGIGGTDLKGIGGTDLKGIGGTDLKGIGGTDLEGIGGTDAR